MDRNEDQNEKIGLKNPPSYLDLHAPDSSSKIDFCTNFARILWEDQPSYHTSRPPQTNRHQALLQSATPFFSGEIPTKHVLSGEEFIVYYTKRLLLVIHNFLFILVFSLIGAKILGTKGFISQGYAKFQSYLAAAAWDSRSAFISL